MIKDYKEYLKYIPKEILTDELKLFIQHLKQVHVDDDICYSKTHETYRSSKYDYVHEKLTKSNFVNGEPDKNKIDINPIANFWFSIYFSISNTLYTFPFPHHHGSSKDMKEADINTLMSIISYLNDKSIVIEEHEVDLSPFGTKGQIVRKAKSKIVTSWKNN